MARCNSDISDSPSAFECVKGYKVLRQKKKGKRLSKKKGTMIFGKGSGMTWLRVVNTKKSKYKKF
jgi:hypothetical protein